MMDIRTFSGENTFNMCHLELPSYKGHGTLYFKTILAGIVPVMKPDEPFLFLPAYSVFESENSNRLYKFPAVCIKMSTKALRLRGPPGSVVVAASYSTAKIVFLSSSITFSAAFA